MRLAFTVSTINPLTGKRLREYKKAGINGFISESYRLPGQKPQWVADHCIAWCNCGRQHSFFGIGETPTKAYIDCLKDLGGFTCKG
jgi:hypothetical protein